MNVPSPTMQRYAAEIYRLQQDQIPVPLAQITEVMESSHQAIARMVRRMEHHKYLVHEPYRGVQLSEEGEQIAMPALRRHRLVEVYLVRQMGYDWASAHGLSDVLVHGVNDELEDRIDELCGHPTRCPHGEPIPNREGVIPVIKDVPLNSVPAGSDCVISRVRTHDPDKLDYIAELGLTPGTPFHLLSCAPFQGPLRLIFDRQLDHVIGHELAGALWVEVVAEGPGNSPLSV